jgi:hypothetical protein
MIAPGATTTQIEVSSLDNESSYGERSKDEQVVIQLLTAEQSGSGSGSSSYTIDSPSQATITIRENDDGATPQVNSLCSTCGKTDLLPSSPASDGGDPGKGAVSSSGIDVANGQVENVDPGLTSSGFGETFGPSLAWSNISALSNTDTYGVGWVDSSLPSFQQFPDGQILVVASGTSALWFDPNQQQSGTTYVAEFYEGSEYTLQADAGSNEFLLTDPQGDQIRFYGFGSNVAEPVRGQFKSLTDPGGNTTTVTSDNADGQIAEVQRSSTTNGVTTTESFVYTYGADTNSLGDSVVQNVELRRQVGSGNWIPIRQAVFTYYGDTSSYGNPGDLETEQIKDGNGHVLDTSYFRYYQPSKANGYTDGLEYYFSPESYARLAQAMSQINVDPLAAGDALVAPYADDYYQYDTQQRVTLETTQGAGAIGPGTYTYSYTTNTNPNYTPGYNAWQTKTVETLPDGNENIYYTNYAGEVMLTDFSDINDPTNPALSGKDWITLDRYDGQGRLIEEAEPSAVTGYSDGNADLMNFQQDGTSMYLSNSSGVINLYDYGASTTATSTTPGDVLGYAKDDKVQVGQVGTPILLDSTQYIANTANGVTVYPQATSTVYRNADGTGAETTTDTYTWYAGTNQIQSDTTTAPVVSGAGSRSQVGTLENKGFPRA